MSRASHSFWNGPLIRNWLLWAVLLTLGRLPAFADHSATLGWDPSPDTNTVGYKVYYGGTSGIYTNNMYVGNVTTGTVYGLTGGATYYFSATAVSGSGAESIFSNEASAAIPQSVSQPPTLAPIANVNVYQNVGLQTINLTGISAGTSGNATLSVYAVASDNGTIISAPAINYTNPNTTGTLMFATVPGATGTATVTVTVNNGGVSNNLATQQFTVTVLPAAVVGQPPTLNPITNLTVYGNAGWQTVNLTGISAGTSGNSTVNVSAISSDNGTIISTPTIAYTNSNSTGALIFAPVTNAWGAATVTVIVNNGGVSNNLVSQQFTVTVLPVPTLNAITNLTIYQNSGSQTVALTGITPGTTNSNLTLTILVYTSDSTIIPTPTVNYTSPDGIGSLTLAPVPGALGTATVTVTANNGVANFSQVFTVTVVPAPSPTLNAITNLTIYQNSGTQAIALTGISPGTANGNLPLTIWAYTSDSTIIPTPTVNYTSLNSTGTLAFAPIPGALGTATVTVKANNGVANFSQVFTVTVVPAPPPTLNAITNLTIYENAKPQMIALTGITPGWANPNQAMVVSAVSSNLAVIPAPKVNYSCPSNSGTLTFAPATNALGTSVVTVTVTDGSASNNIATQTFSITVVIPPGGNHPPTLNSITNISIIQGTVSQNITLSGITSGSSTEKQNLVLSATSSNPGLVPTPIIHYTSPASTATLTLDPKATGLGAAIITVTVNDGGRSNNIVVQSFTVTVVSNQPPTLNAIANMGVPKNAASQTVTLTGISSGSPTENQVLTLSASSSNPNIIPTPTIKYTGPATTATLTFKPLPNITGIATVTVTVNDGGKSNNVVHQSFIIMVSTNIISGVVTGLNTAANLTTMIRTAGQFNFQVTGIAGGKYAVEASSDLTRWSSVQTNTSPFTFQDKMTNGVGQRFYRATFLPGN
jgi:hypothetical protein